mgnify:CR=1 FL=1
MKYIWYNYFNVYNREECLELSSQCKENASTYYKDRPAVGKKVETQLIESEKLPLLKRFFDTLESVEILKRCFV